HHLREVYLRYESIESDVWCKIIAMQRHQRLAKAYIRSPTVTVDASEDGFTENTIGLGGFGRRGARGDKEVKHIMQRVSQGVTLRTDPDGNIYCRRLTDADVIVKRHSPADGFYAEEESSDAVAFDEEVKIFSMASYKRLVAETLTEATYLSRCRFLQLRCFVGLAFVTESSDWLTTPCWICLINIAALDYLHSCIQQLRARRHGNADAR
ncbi:PREDICTED: uncharacterized protein LOC106819154, partial [Priapulus caudatus]|uniref:Uncharacterized protein LOC106819154 n=1 Tax=Priapulus caudatus TaxID=37621 RepID=A0ABM1F4C3_PRICU